MNLDLLVRWLEKVKKYVDGQNPAPVYPIIYKVYTYQAVQDFVHQQYVDSLKWSFDGDLPWLGMMRSLL